MNSSVSILNYYAVEKCCQFDFDLRQLDGVPLGYIQEYNTAYFKANTDKLSFLQTSCLATADRFTDDIVDIDSINEISCSLRDMEGGAIAQVCTSNNIPLYMIKGVTDVYGLRSSQEQFYENLTKVSNGFADIVLTAIDNIKQK
jgi:nucleoside phosphorylase